MDSLGSEQEGLCQGTDDNLPTSQVTCTSGSSSMLSTPAHDQLLALCSAPALMPLAMQCVWGWPNALATTAFADHAQLQMSRCICSIHHILVVTPRYT